MNATTKARAASASATSKRRRRKTPEPVEPAATVVEDHGSRPPLPSLAAPSPAELAYRALLVECHENGTPEDATHTEEVLTAALRTWEHLAADLAELAEQEPAAVRRRVLVGLLTDLHVSGKQDWHLPPHVSAQRLQSLADADNVADFIAPAIEGCFAAFAALVKAPEPRGSTSATNYLSAEGIANVERAKEADKSYKSAKDRLFSADVAFFDSCPNAEIAHKIQRSLGVPGPRTPLPEKPRPAPQPPKPSLPHPPPGAHIRRETDTKCKQYWESRSTCTSQIHGLGSLHSFVSYLYMKIQDLENRLDEKGPDDDVWLGG